MANWWDFPTELRAAYERAASARWPGVKFTPRIGGVCLRAREADYAWEYGRANVTPGMTDEETLASVAEELAARAPAHVETIAWHRYPRVVKLACESCAHPSPPVRDACTAEHERELSMAVAFLPGPLVMADGETA